ncbi:unnamed protein product [Cylicocyclus nassatus]|uniref:Galectin n=1 Tax=Cylicocyclus nassatus TaxID=53992 RepID=A0AA36M6H1_CYLNA|nr:unnamed protein product [Cylicocyclus nassatus]
MRTTEAKMTDRARRGQAHQRETAPNDIRSSIDVAMAHPGDAPVPVPYLKKLGQPLKAGQTLDIHGRINRDAYEVEINLLHDAPTIDPGQCVLNINLRFDEMKIVMNSYLNGEWGKEEGKSMPYKQGEAYDLKIRVQEVGFEIWCDEKKLHTYKHRIGYDAIDYIQIEGDCTLSGVHWGGRYYNIPWETAFPDGNLRAGQSILIHAISKGESWSLNLLGEGEDGEDILFHFNPRFGEKQIVRNSQIDGYWGEEEREGPFPFEKKHGFDLRIENEPYAIHIFVNNERIGTFKHRTPQPTEDYTGIRIDGDIEVTNVEFV